MTDGPRLAPKYSIKCPECDAPIGARCTGALGRERISVHRTRWDLTVAGRYGWKRDGRQPDPPLALTTPREERERRLLAHAGRVMRRMAKRIDVPPDARRTLSALADEIKATL